MNRAQRCEVDAVRVEMRRRLQDPAEMDRFMDSLFGPGSWTHDAFLDAWVAPDSKHTGPGRAYYIVQRGGDYQRMVMVDPA